MEWKFPAIKTTKTAKQQVLKVEEETGEFLSARRKHAKDLEAVDIYHAAETLLRIHFRGREEELDKVMEQVVKKNRDRKKYL